MRGNLPRVDACVHNRNNEGLSPRMRGNPTRMVGQIPTSGEGSIPAHAGEPLLEGRRQPCIRTWVYPRACGGTTAFARPWPEPHFGSIPAHAGEPAGGPVRHRPHHPRVYPRACGGTHTPDSCDATMTRMLMGLSPRMRGNHQDDVLELYAMPGSIPAHAGEPCASGPA